MRKPHVREYRITSSDGSISQGLMTLSDARRRAKIFGHGAIIEIKKPEGRWFKLN